MPRNSFKILYTQIKMILPIAPITSDRWYPYDINLEAGFLPTQMENIEIKKPDRSLNI